MLKAPPNDNNENMENNQNSSGLSLEKVIIKNNEKGQLEETINNIRESYGREIELIESSYK